MQNEPAGKYFSPRVSIVTAMLGAFLFGARLTELFGHIQKQDQAWGWADIMIALGTGMLPVLCLWRAWQFIPESAPWTAFWGKAKVAEQQPHSLSR